MDAGRMATHWADVLRLRGELLDQRGQLADLQMSLYAAVFRTQNVHYEDPEYYGEITEPTPGLVDFMARIAQRLWTPEAPWALYHLDQGMGGGKSHALVGLYHMVQSTGQFFTTELGTRVHSEAEEQTGNELAIRPTRLVVLAADHMTPGVASAEYGPAATLYERFLWTLFAGDRSRYEHFREQGPNKAALQRALEAVGQPVLILLDELMDYVLALSDASRVGGMPAEQVFLNALMDTVDDVPNVAFVVVMIRSDLDERGYNEGASAIRDYVAQRLERNGTTATVTAAEDFGAILRRRIFERWDDRGASVSLAESWQAAASIAWEQQVFERLPAERSLTRLAVRIPETYPFHPDLMGLVQNDWARHVGFQRVRSTVRIFALAAYHWLQEYQAGRWAPALIGVGDVPLRTAIEQVLSSGLLHGNEKAVQGFRAVAESDITTKDGSGGRAVAIDETLAQQLAPATAASRPATRMSTALFLYSLVGRAHAQRGATKAELMAAAYGPTRSMTYAEIEEAFTALVSPDDGLGALEITGGGGGARYQLTVSQTLRMFFRQERQRVLSQNEAREAFLWDRVENLAKSGPFDRHLPIATPTSELTPLSEVFGDVDAPTSNRLVVLDPRYWQVLNGDDSRTREEVAMLLGLGERRLPVDFAASCVVACANTQRWKAVRQKAIDVLAYRGVLPVVDPGSELYEEAQAEYRRHLQELDRLIRGAFGHIALLTWTERGVEVEWRRLDEEQRSALNGQDVWNSLVAAGRAVERGMLSGEYLRTLLDLTKRDFALREVFQKFWRDAAFPLVPGEDEARRAIFNALDAADGWEIIGPDGDRLQFASPGQLPIRSMEYVVRPARAVELPEEERIPDYSGTGERTPAVRKTGEEPPVYKRYVIELPNRSLTNDDARRAIWMLLSQLTEAFDPNNRLDLQLINGRLVITAQQGSFSDIPERVTQAGGRWMEEVEEFY